MSDLLSIVLILSKDELSSLDKYNPMALMIIWWTDIIIDADKAIITINKISKYNWLFVKVIPNIVEIITKYNIKSIISQSYSLN